MRQFLAYLFFPITILYGIITKIRNYLYDTEVFGSKKHTVLIISVGNIKVGGTGKTPHVEMLVNILQKKYKLAVLSRGYGRKTKGYRLLNENDTALTVGDEPLQMFKKNKNIPFAVCVNRNKGVELLMKDNPDLQIIILDDAFQYRAIKHDISFLLTEYNDPLFDDKVLPFGMLREFKKGYKRSDYILVTKAPETVSIGERGLFESKLKPKKYQKVFFSHIDYQDIYNIFDNSIKDNLSNKSIFLLTGIANNTPIVEYISDKATIIKKLEFSDHHNFTKKDIDNIISLFNSKKQDNTIILTTEKDATRLLQFDELKNLPIYALPITLKLTSTVSKSYSFEQILLEDVRKNTTYSKIH